MTALTAPRLDEALRARVGVLHSRSLRLAALRRLALAAVPVWVLAHARIPSGLLSWFVCLLFAFAWAETAVYASLEHYWARHGAGGADDGLGVVIHARWSRSDEFCSGLGYGLGIVSMVPWAAVVMGGVPREMLQPLTWLALALAATCGGFSRW